MERRKVKKKKLLFKLYAKQIKFKYVAMKWMVEMKLEKQNNKTTMI